MSDRDWNAWFRDRFAKHQEEAAAKLAQAKEEASARGKEPFDLDKLDQQWRLWTPYRGGRPPREELIRSMEEAYYVTYGDIMTLAEFARRLELNDIGDGGDMHIEEREIRDRETRAAREQAAPRGKEPFDLAALDRLYETAKGRFGKGGEARQWWEYAYYVEYPDVMTIAEFAERLARSDSSKDQS